jgi:hypothetical protein
MAELELLENADRLGHGYAAANAERRAFPHNAANSNLAELNEAQPEVGSAPGNIVASLDKLGSPTTSCINAARCLGQSIVLDIDSSVNPSDGDQDWALERPFRMHLLSAAVRVLPVWRSRSLREGNARDHDACSYAGRQTWRRSWKCRLRTASGRDFALHRFNLEVS